MFHAIGNFCYRFRWIVIAVWVVLFGVSVVATPLLANVLTAGFTNPNAPSQEASADVIQKTFKQGETNVLVVFTSDTLQATSDEFKAAEQKALDAVSGAKIADLQSIQTYASTGSDLLVSKDGTSSVAVLNFSAPAQTVQKQLQTIRTAALGRRPQDVCHRRPGRQRGAHRLLLQGPAQGRDLRAASRPHRSHLRVRQPGRRRRSR